VAEQTPDYLYSAAQALIDREELVERYRPYVFSIAKQVSQSFPMRIDFEELVGYGMIGLLEAADRYDPRRNVSFTTFSHYRIKGAVFDGLRQMGILTRTPNDDWARREAVINDLIQTASDDNTENASASVDDEIQSISKLVDSLIPAYLLSLSRENAPDVPDTRDLPNVAIEFQDTFNLVYQIVRELPEKEREIIEALYFTHFSTTELANKMGVNKSWVSRLHSKAINRVRQKLAEIGILSDS
jgi:RNA polymerase sigma factor for flagellar operon FliA